MTFSIATSARRLLLPAALSAALSALSACAVAQEGPQNLPAITLNAGMYNIRAQVAQDDSQRAVGLMHRKDMPQTDGMLFVFDESEGHCFWMKNTLLPLSIAFLADDGTIVNIEDMKAETLDSHCPKKAVRYALEMNQGWFAKRGIKAGAKLTGGPFTKSSAKP